jgi:haloalkane dehalogenase
MTAEHSPRRPFWVPQELYPFESHYAQFDGTSAHYVDEGEGPPLLLLHGNPTWSFLYRELIRGLRDRYRCVAPDHPGFGLSRAGAGFGYTPAEHAAVLERLVLELDLTDVTMMVQDWGGPIGFAVATRHPDRFDAFVIGNTWAWPKSDPGTQLFSRMLGGALGSYLILKHNFFVEKIIRSAVANANEQDVAPRNTLYVAKAWADPGPIIKRFQPKDRGKAYPIKKRTSHLIVALDQREE